MRLRHRLETLATCTNLTIMVISICSLFTASAIFLVFLYLKYLRPYVVLKHNVQSLARQIKQSPMIANAEHTKLENPLIFYNDLTSLLLKNHLKLLTYQTVILQNNGFATVQIDLALEGYFFDFNQWLHLLVRRENLQIMDMHIQNLKKYLHINLQIKLYV